MRPLDLPYFITWSTQENASTFDVDAVEDFYYLSGDTKVLDFSSTSYQASFGLKNEEIEKKMATQLSQMSICSPKGLTELKRESSNQLLSLLGDHYSNGKILWTNSGAESVENALKMARDYTGKKVIVAREQCYHGATLGALSITGDWRNHAVQTIDEWTLRIPEPKEDPDGTKARNIIESFGPEKIAGICLETMTGGNGVIIPSALWYDNIQKICDQYKIPLILDEVICAMGRTGKTFGLHHYPNLRPQFICMAKALTGGFFPLGALWCDHEIAASYNDKTLPCGLTNYAHPIGLAAFNAVFSIVNNNHKALEKRIKLFNKSLGELTAIKGVKEIRSIGLLAAIDTNFSQDWHHLIKRGLYAIAHKNQLIIAPALNMPEEIIEQGLYLTSEYLKDLA